MCDYDCSLASIVLDSTKPQRQEPLIADKADRSLQNGLHQKIVATNVLHNIHSYFRLEIEIKIVVSHFNIINSNILGDPAFPVPTNPTFNL